MASPELSHRVEKVGGYPPGEGGCIRYFKVRASE